MTNEEVAVDLPPLRRPLFGVVLGREGDRVTVRVSSERGEATITVDAACVRARRESDDARTEEISVRELRAGDRIERVISGRVSGPRTPTQVRGVDPKLVIDVRLARSYVYATMATYRVLQISLDARLRVTRGGGEQD